MNRSTSSIVAAWLASTVLAPLAPGALVVPFTETFAADTARWSDRSSFRALSFIAAGGKDGSSYASGSFAFTGNGAGDQVAVLRGQGNFNSSTSNFVGNWITGGVATFSVDVRQQTGTDAQMYIRFATAAGFPGAAYTVPFLIPHNTWTTVTVGIAANNPGFTFENFRDPMDPNFNTLAFADAFSAISRVQIAVSVPQTLAGTTTPVVFDIDNPTIVPAPGIGALACAGLLARCRRARREQRGHAA